MREQEITEKMESEANFMELKEKIYQEFFTHNHEQSQFIYGRH